MIVFCTGRRSQLRISQRRKPKRTSKNLQIITTSKVAFYLITTMTSLHQKWLFSSSLLLQSEHRKEYQN
jgi:hypothetical protein